MQSVLIAFLFGVVLVLIVISYVIATFGLTGFFGAPYVGTPTGVAREMLKNVGFKEGETITDLGSGSGTILITAVRDFGASKAIGYEINPILVWITRLKAKVAGVSDKVQVRRANFYKVDFEPTDVLGLYLLSETMAKLEGKMKSQFSPDARLVSRGFAIPGTEPKKHLSTHRSNMYIYRIGDLH